MNDEREFVSLETAISMLHDRDGRVHTFRDSAIGLIGADWTREQVIDAMRGSPHIEITGPNAQKMGHGLAITDETGQLFIETHEPRAAVVFAPTPEEVDGAPDEDVLSIWTLYDSPIDMPGYYVLRRHVSGRGGSQPTPEVYWSKDAEALRDMMRERCLHRMPRQPGDDPPIVETWM